MKKGKRAQASFAISIILLVLILIIVVVTLVVVLINPNIFYPKVVQTQEPSIIIKTITESPTQPTCFYPFRQLGNTCCVDSDLNNICDNDEVKKAKTPSCSYPYMRDGDSCCLDDNDNGFCDMYENHYIRYYRYGYYGHRSGGCVYYPPTNTTSAHYDCDW